MSDDQGGQTPHSSGLGLPLRVVDSALIIAIVVAVLNYAGWTFRLAYLKRFSIDPSSLDASGISIAVDGVGAIGTTLLAWIAASAFLLLSGVCMWAFVWLVERRRGRSGPLADQTAVMMAQAGGVAFALLFILWGGSIAGGWAADERIANVRDGNVWIYHVKGEAIPAVPIAQGGDRIWLLTKVGVRPVPTRDVQLIDGPLFQRLSAGTAGKADR